MNDLVDSKMLVADVKVTERLDALVVTPRQHGVAAEAMRRLLTHPGIGPVRMTAEGVRVPARTAHKLPDTVAGVDLRWSAEARRFMVNRRRARGVHDRLYAVVTQIRDGAPEAARTFLADLRDIDTLDAHQVVNVAAMTVPDSYGMCVFDEQGAGKTVTCIYAFDTLVARDQADLALIVAPKSMIAEWPKDFQRFRGGVYEVTILTGPRNAKLRALSQGADVLVTNFETVVQLEAELRAELRRRSGRAVLVVDESFFIKSLDARRTRALRHLREWCDRAFVLCGTPAPNSPHDLVQQFNIVDFGLTFDGVEIPDDREDAREVVRAAMEERGLYTRHLKSDVLPGLPAKRFNRIHVPLAPLQRKLYEGVLRDLILDLTSTDDAGFRRRIASFFAKRSALLQCCSCPQSLAPEYRETPGKLAALDGVLEELVGRRREKVVIWSFYTASIDAIVARYQGYGAVRYDGTVANVAERREAVRRFQEDKETMLFIANPAAAGAGLTLHRARYAVYESLSSQAAHYLQSLDRIHRRGQERDVEIVILLCDQSIEVQEYQRLLTKERSAQDLLGDLVTEPPTRQSFLNEAQEALGALLGVVGLREAPPAVG